MKREAVFSDCGRYRYRLYREWAPSEKRPILWVMLNPSIADDKVDDPTIRRCIGFSRTWGYGACWIGNIYAYVSGYPDVLWTMSATEARGPDNDRHICEMSQEVDRIVVAWGVVGGELPRKIQSPELWCLGVTKAGTPRHPLYVRADTPLQKWK